ncbi:hypothetical protein CRM22_010538 [Opisthorchis felineus]|uniref:Uncharacterized protein n=1 Tax=Opisthorchis felineus TaxID=147828 RepID=A0A4S2L334_OPIFE|nr:hypothetical protein CRM22_010538 [Opisthorchis felineus]
MLPTLCSPPLSRSPLLCCLGIIFILLQVIHSPILLNHPVLVQSIPLAKRRRYLSCARNINSLLPHMQIVAAFAIFLLSLSPLFVIPQLDQLDLVISYPRSSCFVL